MGVIPLCSPTIAQPVTRENITPGSVPETTLPDPLPFPDNQVLPRLDELFPLIERSTPSNPNLDLDRIPTQIIVNDFAVEGSTVFTQEQFAELLSPYLDRPISFGELLEAQDTITKLYFNRGYITSGAIIPPQALENGVVKIQIIEGRVEEVNLFGLNHLDDGYILSRLRRATKAPLNQNDLLASLQLLQVDPLVDSLSVELSAGARPGLSLLEIVAKESDPFSITLSTDNQRSPSVGSVRRRIAITHNNLSGFGDRVNVAYVETEGSKSLDDLSYEFPINSRNGTLSASYSLTDSEIIEYPFNNIDIDSRSNTYEVTLRQPLSQSPTKEFAMGIKASHQETTTSLLNIPFPLANGADDNGKTKISALRFFQEYTNRDSQQVLALRSQFNLGISAFNATQNDDAPDSNFASWRGQGQYLRLLKPNTTLLLRSDLQLAGEPLVLIEQFSLGGQLSVRGYRQDSLLADNGLFASAEVRTDLFTIDDGQTKVQISPFFDFGTVWNNDNTALAKNTLASLGLGLRLAIGNNFTANLDWGIPLVDVTSRGNSWQEDGMYFNVQYRPF
ncbi:MAG: ShlB/FhaC/HecB family hemolysin secretion/activation protein [Synechococcaceae cyanobacterium RL_1_2]|nr:ShlB/FhaC/HecB family hemolysin secretion/activation protein [Synechococcaceae cyanobacterium RL_1_2]